jgi:ribosomal protein L7/L12
MSIRMQTVALTMPLNILIIGAAAFMARSEQRIATIARVEVKVDLLLTHSGLSFDPHAYLSQYIVDAVREGKKIKAIRLYCQSHRGSLKDAKEFIEMQRRVGVV